MKDDLKIKAICAGVPHGLRMVKNKELHYIAYASKKRLALVSPAGVGELWKCKWKSLPDGVKPIYRPWSDLESPIKHDGKEFVPMDVLKQLYATNLNVTENNMWLHQETEAELSVLTIAAIRDELSSWHFNVFHLPDTAVIYTDALKQNPYE